MSRGWHYIEADLADEPDYAEEWAAAGIGEIEELLGKHAAFSDFCDERDVAA